VSKDFPCECGHIRQSEETLNSICVSWHDDRDNDHQLAACRYCDCKRYRPSNLKYLERLAEKYEY